jgi:hypothetical protein
MRRKLCVVADGDRSLGGSKLATALSKPLWEVLGVLRVGKFKVVVFRVLPYNFWKVRL